MSERTKEIRLVVVKLATVLNELLALTRPGSSCKLRDIREVGQDRPKLVLVKLSEGSESVSEE